MRSGKSGRNVSKLKQFRGSQGESGEVRKFLSEKLKDQGKSGKCVENFLQRVLISSIPPSILM